MREIKEEAEMPPGWVRACDEEMIATHLGVANLSDSYESAKAKLNAIICWHIAVATDPAINGGYQLVPVEPTPDMINAWNEMHGSNQEGRPVWKLNVDRQAYYTYKAMLAAAPKEAS